MYNYNLSHEINQMNNYLLQYNDLNSQNPSQQTAYPISNDQIASNNFILSENKTNQLIDDSSMDYLDYSMDALIEVLVPTPSYIPKEKFLYSMLLCSRMNIRPSLLFNRLANLTIKSILNMTSDESIRTIKNYIYILSQWTRTFPYDFRNNEMISQLQDLFKKLILFQPNFQSDLDHIYKKLQLKLKSLDNYEEYIKQLNKKTMFNLTQSNLVTDIIHECSTSILFAQQLTHIELDRLKSVGDEELIQYFIMKFASEESDGNKNKSSKSLIHDKKLTFCLELYIQWFNRLTVFIPTEIVKHTQKRSRVKLINFFIDSAYQCFHLHNFNSMIAIISGLNMQPVKRLKRSWEKVEMEKFHQLEEYINVSKNFSTYRLIYKLAMEEAEKNKWTTDKFVIPFLSITLQDVYFIKTHSQDYNSDRTINFKKYYSMAKFISEEFQRCKQSKCSFERNDDVINYIITSPTFNEDSLMLASFECEPPINISEKDKYKILQK
ncbi:unnamed protein product [Rotaria socialis]|uniref:Ras guanine nucleotide exchange factor n=2 Tax=Rotaria socialis TaxID=392032 RepID=A0A817X453_9BILA|nr:unnamed protein product [Rotaria socialis]CAF3363412.1 unnamed protein product [Rotaria socialis]CAF3405558.1 unnamed protein product [Rotaria socialis]CAF3729675.1 unnamed protein product [Rotaria socialis]CAF3789877.1 unnamed protein product [Rotaria socialis]